MSVIETRYRDITCEELRRLHSEMDFEAFADEEWQRMRNSALTNDREWNVCSHLAELGD